MPLTSKAKVYKQLPQDLADSVFQAGKSIKTKGKIIEKRQCYEEQRKENLKKKHEPYSDTCSSSEEPSTTKRQRTPQSDTTSPSVPNTPMSVGSDDPEISELYRNVHPLSFALGIRPPSAMDTDSRHSSPPSLTSRPRLQRCDSRTTSSLDNVEMWESDSELETVDSNSSHFDRINGVLINPRATYDLSELRKLSSSTSSRLVQTIPPSRSPSSTPSPRCQTSPRQSSPKKRRPLKLSLPKTAIVGNVTSPLKTEKNLSTAVSSTKLRDKSGGNIQSKKDSINMKLNMFDSYVKESLPGPRSASYLRNPAGGTLSLAISHRRESNKMTKEPSATCSKSTQNERRPSMDEKRRVKFNTLVMVTDGESRSTDILRSSKNSAQLLKQRFLKSDCIRPQSPISGDENPKEYWEMVC